MKSVLKIISFLFLLSSCQSGFNGYTSIGNDAYFKLLSFENSSESYTEGNYLSASIKVYDHEELKYRWFKHVPFQLTDIGFDNLLKQFNIGDSVEFLIHKSLFLQNNFGFNGQLKAEYITVYVKLLDFYTEQEYAQLNKNIDMEMIEQQMLKQYVKEEKNLILKEGIYIQPQKSETTGEPIKRGMTLNLKYTGHFITGKVFDTTFTNQSFEYVYGTPNQVIEGFDKALITMKIGEKAKIIIPSQFAFGEDGSSTGIVPPYSTLVYNLEIININ